jgi:ribosome biogenesis GTPase
VDLADLGWNGYFSQHFERFRNDDFAPGRIVCEHRRIHTVYTEHGELAAKVSGRFRHSAESRSDFPTVGDWVAIKARPGEGTATIHALLPRKSSFSRKAVPAGGPAYGPGKTEEQILAANVDTAFLVSGLDGDFSLRRIERYLTLVWDSGATPVIVLNKADVCTDIEAHIAAAQSVALGVPIHPVSALENQGLDVLLEYLGSGKTGALLGSSGVGKSTLINGLLGEERQQVGAVRESDSRGRHITSHRELILLPGGGAIIDNPGLRELQVWGDQEGLKGTFSDIEELAGLCRFRDCGHQHEPGCAIRQALKDGTLDPGRWQSYLKLKKELRFLTSRQDQKAHLAEKAKWKKISQWSKKMNKYR